MKSCMQVDSLAAPQYKSSWDCFRQARLQSAFCQPPWCHPGLLRLLCTYQCVSATSTSSLSRLQRSLTTSDALRRYLLRLSVAIAPLCLHATAVCLARADPAHAGHGWPVPGLRAGARAQRAGQRHLLCRVRARAHGAGPGGGRARAGMRSRIHDTELERAVSRHAAYPLGQAASAPRASMHAGMLDIKFGGSLELPRAGALYCPLVPQPPLRQAVLALALTCMPAYVLLCFRAL